jgi:predicted  nucleic acid-binding Zn-ribbon protein
VKEVIRVLIALQRLDNQIASWRTIVAEGPDKLSQLRLKLTALEEEMTTLSAQLASSGQKKRELEAESADLVDRKAINQTRQLKAKNNEEYRAVLKEAEAILNQVTSRDNELLTLMEEMEKLEARKPDLEKAIQEETILYESQRNAIVTQVEESQKADEAAQAERARLTAALPPDVLGRYNIVARNRDGQAIAAVSDGQCQVCRLSVPPQLFNELQKNDRLLSCPNCARIIYWPGHPDLKPPEETPADPSLKAHG